MIHFHQEVIWENFKIIQLLIRLPASTYLLSGY